MMRIDLSNLVAIVVLSGLFCIASRGATERALDQVHIDLDIPSTPQLQNNQFEFTSGSHQWNYVARVKQQPVNLVEVQATLRPKDTLLACSTVLSQASPNHPSNPTSHARNHGSFGTQCAQPSARISIRRSSIQSKMRIWFAMQAW